MASIHHLARMLTPTTGGGPIILTAVVPGYLSFNGVGLKDGDGISYAIIDGNNVEFGRGVYRISGPSLSRSVTQSSNGNLPLELTGSAEVYITEAPGSGSAAVGSGGTALSVEEGPGIDVIGPKVGLGGDTVLLFKSNGEPVAEFSMSAAGLAQALAAAVNGDVVTIPAGTIGGDVTVPAGVTLVGLDRSRSILTGQVTVAGVLDNLSVIRSADSSAELVGVVVDGGTVRAVTANVTQTTGNAVGILISGANSVLDHCAGSGISTSGAGRGILQTTNAGTGTLEFVESINTGGGLGSVLTNEALGTTRWRWVGEYVIWRITMGPGHNVPGTFSMRATLTGLSVGTSEVLKNNTGLSIPSAFNAAYSPDVSLTGAGTFTLGQSKTVTGSVTPDTNGIFYICLDGGSSGKEYIEFTIDELTFSDGITTHPIWGVEAAGAAAAAHYCAANGSTEDITGAGGALELYACQYETASGVTVQAGDRAAFDTANHPTLHASDIADGTFTYHLDPDNPITGNMEGVYSVKEYGATGDGTTVDTTGIQAAIDEAHTAGGIVYFPPGTYLSGPLTCYRNVGMIGAGRRVSTVKANASGTLFDYGSDDGFGFGFFTSEIRDLSLEGDSTGTTGISIIGGLKTQFTRIEVNNFTGTAIYLRRVLIGQAYDVTLLSNAIGIDADYGTSPTYGFMAANLMYWQNCTIQSNSSWAVKWKTGCTVVFVASNFEDNGTTGNAATGAIHYTPFDAGTAIKFDSCYFENNHGKADVVIAEPDADGQYCIFDNCQFTEIGDNTYAIYLDGSNDTNYVIVRASRFYDHASTDFYADGAGATFYLDQTNGTTGGSGTFVTSGADTDEKAKVSSNDSTPGYLNGKLVAGANITLTEGSDGGNETLTIASTATASSGEVLMETGTSNPPVPLTNEAGDDWLYEG